MRAPIDALLERRDRAPPRRARPRRARGHPLDAARRTEMDDATLRDELLTLLVAGHETTATALAWALERLARHPQRLGAACAPATRTTSTPSCKETLRLRPVVPAVLRLLKAPIEHRRLRPARGRRGPAEHPADAHARGHLPGPVRVPPGALPRAARRHLHLDPVRRRRAPLPRRELRALRDEGRAARGRGRGRDARARRRERAPEPPRGHARPGRRRARSAWRDEQRLRAASHRSRPVAEHRRREPRAALGELASARPAAPTRPPARAGSAR